MCGFAPHGAASVMPGWAVSNIDRFKKSMRFCEILGLGAVSAGAAFDVFTTPPMRGSPGVGLMGSGLTFHSAPSALCEM